ncbi:MAG: hypothetical protein ACE5FQ_11590 [Thiogranum sp.]
MMKKLYVCGAVAFASAMPLAVSAGLDGSSEFLCASVDVMECLPTSGCNRVAADDVDIPRFIRVNVKEKRIVTGAKDDKRVTAIERVETVDGKLMLQGAEDGREGGERDGVGWSLSVVEDSGDMVLTASGDGVAFVVFGACTSTD